MSDGYAADSTPHQRELADALREVRRCVPEPQTVISEHLQIQPQTLSGYLHAARTPDRDIVEGFYDFAEKYVVTEGGSMLYTREEVLRRHELAQVKHCPCCRVGYPVEVPEATDPDRKPAIPLVRNRRRKLRRRQLSRARSLAAPAAQAMLPVSLPQGDRQYSTSENPTWTALEDLVRHLREGREQDAGVMLRYAGRIHPASDVPNVVGACRVAGLHEAADTVLHYAGQRDSNAVHRLARSFIAEQHYSDADMLLRAAISAAS
jgi:hypothetical protein